MDNREFYEGFLAFLNLVGVPQYEDEKLRYLSSNLVGDATFLLEKTSGPAWDEIKKRSKESGLVK